MSFQQAHAEIQKLVLKFDSSRDLYLSPAYQEIEVRQHFIDPLFIALGWDVRHEREDNPFKREVHIEQPVLMAEGRKRADYAFSIYPEVQRVKFFAEAKKPASNLLNANDCFQTIRYGWNSKNQLSLLLDFEDIYILDCRAKPSVQDAASRWLEKWNYKDLLDEEEFRRFYYLFSRDAVAEDSLERYFEVGREPRRRNQNRVNLKQFDSRQRRLFSVSSQPVDNAFLRQLDTWRAELAHDIATARPELAAYALTETTQRALDRLVFLRFLEDKGIELEQRVATWDSSNAWREFTKTSRKLDSKYNGVLWKKHPILDSESFAPKGEAWARIAFAISYHDSPYLFNLIPIPILGSIYERFLGNEIEIVDGNIQINLKPELRKVGGVYYTPEYVVRYIVKNTLGKMLTGKTPNDVRSMRFIDIACGSGSFILGLYDELLIWHTAYYNANPKIAKQDGCEEVQPGVWALSLKQRRSILERNIFGTDIDTQAVEVSKLSLYLKLLEMETAKSATQFQLDFGEKVLPDLEKNIVCGNALIGEDIYLNNMFSEDENRKLNPMTWEDTFPEVFRQGGFDIVVGNPPYGAQFTKEANEYISKKWSIGTKDSAALMMDQALRLLKKGGVSGFIVPKPFIYASNWKGIRKLLLPYITNIVDVGKAWKNVKLEQVIYIAQKAEETSRYETGVRSNEEIVSTGCIEKSTCQEFGFIINGLSNDEVSLGRKLRSQGRSLKDYVTNTRGGSFQALVASGGDGYRAIGGAQVQSYGLRGSKGVVPKNYTLTPNAFVQAGSILVQNIVAHIDNPAPHIKITAYVVDSGEADVVILDTVNQLVNRSDLSSYYIAALLSSRLINWYVYRFIFAKAVRTMHFDSVVSDRIPIIDPRNNKDGDARYSEIIDAYTSRVSSHDTEPNLFTESDNNRRLRRAQSLDTRINRLVYGIYGLQPDEIEIIEQSFLPVT